MRPRTVQAWLPERPPGPNEAPAHCAWSGLSHVAATARGCPDVSSGQCWGPGLSWPRDSFHPAAAGLDRRGSVAGLLARLAQESKTQRCLALPLDCEESWGPVDAPPLQNVGPESVRRRRHGRPPPRKRSLALSGFSIGHWFPASLGFLLSVLSPCTITSRGSGDSPIPLRKAAPASEGPSIHSGPSSSRRTPALKEGLV